MGRTRHSVTTPLAMWHETGVSTFFRQTRGHFKKNDAPPARSRSLDGRTQSSEPFGRRVDAPNLAQRRAYLTDSGAGPERFLHGVEHVIGRLGGRLHGGQRLGDLVGVAARPEPSQPVDLGLL